jgi:hypothetical protein
MDRDGEGDWLRSICSIVTPPCLQVEDLWRVWWEKRLAGIGPLMRLSWCFEARAQV